MFSQETLGSWRLCGYNSTCTTHPNIVAEQVPLAMVLPNSSDPHIRTTGRATLQTLLTNGLKSTRIQTPQILIWLSIHGTSWTISDLWRPNCGWDLALTNWSKDTSTDPLSPGSCNIGASMGCPIKARLDWDLRMAALKSWAFCHIPWVNFCIGRATAIREYCCHASLYLVCDKVWVGVGVK